MNGETTGNGNGQVPTHYWLIGIPGAIVVTVLLMTFCGRHMTAPVASAAEATSVMISDLEAIGRRYVRFDLPPIETKLSLGAVRETTPKAEIRGIEFTVNGQRMGGLLGKPLAPGPRPVIVVLHPSDSPYVTGLHTATTVKALAEAGYIALSPDYRGWGSSQGEKGNEIEDAAAAIREARKIEGADGRVGVLGYSMGGGIALRAALAETNIQALALFYPQMGGAIEEISEIRVRGTGPGAGQMLRLFQFAQERHANEAEVELAIRQTSPIYHVFRLATPLSIFHGEADEVVSILQSRALEREAKGQGKDVEIHILPGLKHAFANEWEGNAGKDALLAFFARTLPPGAGAPPAEAGLPTGGAGTSH